MKPCAFVMSCNTPNTNKPPGNTFGPGQSNGSSLVSLNLSNSILIVYAHANAPMPNPTGVAIWLSEFINTNAATHPPNAGANAGKFGLPTKSGAMRCEFKTPSAPKTKAKERFCCATASATAGSIARVCIRDPLLVPFLLLLSDDDDDDDDDFDDDDFDDDNDDDDAFVVLLGLAVLLVDAKDPLLVQHKNCLVVVVEIVEIVVVMFLSLSLSLFVSLSLSLSLSSSLSLFVSLSLSLSLSDNDDDDDDVKLSSRSRH